MPKQINHQPTLEDLKNDIWQTWCQYHQSIYCDPKYRKETNA